MKSCLQGSLLENIHNATASHQPHLAAKQQNCPQKARSWVSLGLRHYLRQDSSLIILLLEKLKLESYISFLDIPHNTVATSFFLNPLPPKETVLTIFPIKLGTLYIRSNLHISLL